MWEGAATTALWAARPAARRRGSSPCHWSWRYAAVITVGVTAACGAGSAVSTVAPDPVVCPSSCALAWVFPLFVYDLHPEGMREGLAAFATVCGRLRLHCPPSLFLQDKAHTIAVLQEALTRSRVSLESFKRTTAVDVKKKLAAQKDSYDAVVARHLSFIDQLLADKTALSNKVEGLAQNLKTVEEAWEARLRTVRERAAVDLKRAQDGWAAGEKQRREALTRKLEKEIKADTARALEPEVQRILDRQRGEIERMRDEHESRLAREKADLAARHADELTRLRLSVDARVLEGVEAERREWAGKERALRAECEAIVKGVRARAEEEMEAEMRRHSEVRKPVYV